METQEQTFGKESVERSLGYVPADVPMPTDEPQGDVSIQQTELRDAANEITKVRNERQRELESRPVDTAVEVQDQTGRKLPENETLSVEEASWLVTGARTKADNTADLDDREALAREIDAIRNGTTLEQLHAEPKDTITVDAQHQFGEELRQRAEVAQAEAQRHQAELQQTLQNNPALLAAVSQQVAQEQAKVAAAEQQYANAIHHNALAAMAHTLSSFPELQGISDPNQLAGALHAVRARDPARAAAITESIASTRRFVEESQRVQQVQAQQHQARIQQWVNEYDANMHRQFQQHDQAYDQWSRNQGVGKDEQEQIKQEVLDEFRRQGWNDNQIAYAYNTNPAMRSFAGQVQMHQAAAYRLGEKARQSARRKISHPLPHVQRPGSPVERQSDADHYLKRLEKPGEALSAKEAAAFVTARRNAARR